MHLRITAPYPAPSVQFETALPSQLPASVSLPQAWITQINTLAQHAAILPKPPSASSTERSSLEFSRTRREDLFVDEYDQGGELPPEYTVSETEADDLLPYPAAVHALDRAASLSSLLKAVEFNLHSSPPSSEFDYGVGYDDLGRAFVYNACTAHISLADDSSSSNSSPPPSPLTPQPCADAIPALTLSLPIACAHALARVVADVAESGRWDAEARRRRERERELACETQATGDDSQPQPQPQPRGRSKQRGRARTRSVSEAPRVSVPVPSQDAFADESGRGADDYESDSDSLKRKGKKTWHRRARSLSVVGMGLVNFFGSIVESLSRPSSPPPLPSVEASPKEPSPTRPSLMRSTSLSRAPEVSADNVETKSARRQRPAHLIHTRARSTSALPNAASLLPSAFSSIAFPSRAPAPQIDNGSPDEVTTHDEMEIDPRSRSRVLKRQARAGLLDAFRQYVIPAVNNAFVGWLDCVSSASASRHLSRLSVPLPMAYGFPEFGFKSEEMGMFDGVESPDANAYTNNGPWREGGYALWVLGLALRKVSRETSGVRQAIECEQRRVWECQMRERKLELQHRQALEMQVGYGVTRIGGGNIRGGVIGGIMGMGKRNDIENSPFVSDLEKGGAEVDADDASTSTDTDGSSVHTPQEMYAEAGIDIDVVDDVEFVVDARRHRRRKEGEDLPNPHEGKNVAQQLPMSPLSPLSPIHPQTPLPALTHRLTYLSSLQRCLTSLVSSSFSVLAHAASERSAQLAVLEVRARRRAWSVRRLGGRAEARFAGSLGRPGAGSALREGWVACEGEGTEVETTVKTKKGGKKKGKKGRRKEMEKMESISEDEEDEFEFELELELELVTPPSSPSCSSHNRAQSFDGPRDVSPPLSPNQQLELVPFPTTPEPEVLNDFEDEMTLIKGEGEDFCSTGPQDPLPLFGGPVEPESELGFGFGTGVRAAGAECEFDECHGNGCGGCDAFDFDQDDSQSEHWREAETDAGCGFLPFSRPQQTQTQTRRYRYHDGESGDSRRGKRDVEVDPLDVDIEAQAGFEWPYDYKTTTATNGGSAAAAVGRTGYGGMGYRDCAYMYGRGMGRGHGAGMYDADPSTSFSVISTPTPTSTYPMAMTPSRSPSSSSFPSSSTNSMPSSSVSAPSTISASSNPNYVPSPALISAPCPTSISAPSSMSASTGEEFTLALDVPFYATQLVRRTPRGRGHRRAVTLASFVPPS